ncbi:hypothetical protein [Streptomyces noursei]|uniref:hypothetical protein n=1 Tax=Streptomyces noursei TaxID=1971 RepID=UPI0013967531
MVEHLVRAEEVEGLETLEDHKNDAALIHSSTLSSAPEGVNDTYPTLYAMPESANVAAESG